MGGVFRSRALVVLATAALVGMLWAGKVLFVMFFFALFLSFALQPFVTLLEKLRFPRSLAVLTVIVFLSALVVFFVVNAMSQIEAFTRDLPAYATRLRVFTSKAQGVFAQIEERTRLLLPEGDRATRSVRLESDAFDSLSKVALQVKTIVSLLLYTAAVPMLSFFMLKDRERYGGAVVKILRIKGGRAAQDFAVGVARVLSGYVLGELFVVFITARLAVLFAFLFWGILWGVPGAILAVPLTATIKVVTERFERFAPWAALLGDRTPDPVPPEEPEALLAGHRGA